MLTKEVALSLLILLVPAARAQEQRAAPSLPMTRSEKEEFLLNASMVDEGDASAGPTKFPRVTLDDGRKHTPPSRPQPRVSACL